MGLMLRLAATGSDAQINQCLKALRDKEKTCKLAAVVEWGEAHGYHEFLALPKHILHVWTDADAVYAAGKEATAALAEFLKQILDFDHDEDGIFKVFCPSDAPSSQLSWPGSSSSPINGALSSATASQNGAVTKQSHRQCQCLWLCPLCSTPLPRSGGTADVHLLAYLVKYMSKVSLHPGNVNSH